MAKVSKATAATLPAGTEPLLGLFCTILVCELVEPLKGLCWVEGC